MKNIKEIYWFAPYNLKSPSTRYRGKYPLEHLTKKYNIKTKLVFPEKSFVHIITFIKVFLLSLVSRKHNSLIVIQKVCSNGTYAKLLKLLISIKKNTLYDIDDAEYFRRETNTLHFFLKKCNTISVGSTDLEKYCLQFNSNVFLLTSPVISHSFKKRKKNTKPHIGWVGDFGFGHDISKNFSHKKSLLEILFPEIKKINFPIKLILIGVNL